MFEPGSTSWAIRRAFRDRVLRTLPISAHLEVARAYGKLRTRFREVPSAILENMQAAFASSPDHAEEIGRRHLEFFHTLYLVRVLPRLPGFESTAWTVEGIDRLDRALELKRGAILVTAHLGYPRLIGPILRASGYEAVQVVSGRADRLERDRLKAEAASRGAVMRRRAYKNLLGAEQKEHDIVASLDTRPILKALSLNKTVILAADGMRALSFERLTLFGRTYPFPTGFVKLGIVTGAPVLPAFAIDGPRGKRIVVRIHSPLNIDSKADMGTNLQEYAGVLEEQLMQTPYLWTRWNIANLFERSLIWASGPLEEKYSAIWDRT